MRLSNFFLRSLVGGLVAGLCIGAVELGLRGWGGLEADRVASPLAYQSIDQVEQTVAPPLGPGGDLLRWGSWGRATPRAAPGLRVVVLGGSTAEGERVGPFHAFSGLMERALEAASGAPVEVINAGQGGVANRHVALKLGQVLAQGPVDLVVVYSGDNEFLEVLGLKMAVPGWSARVELARRRLWGLHLYRGLARAVIPALNRSVAPSGVAARSHQLSGRIEPEERALVELLHREALHEMIDRAQAAGVPILLATVADNLRHRGRLDGPAGAEPGAGPPPPDRLAAWLGAPPEVLAARMADPAALSGQEWFALGEALLARGQRALAVEALLHAEQLDTAPHRSSRVMRADLLEISAARGAARCDVAGALRAEGAIGDDSFLDACHPNLEGHARIAQALLQCIEAQQLLPVRGVAGLPFPAPPDPLALDGRRALRAEGEPGRDDDGSAEGALRAAHQAFLHRRPSETAVWLTEAESRGAPAATVARSRLLAQIYGDNGVRQAKEIAAAAHALGDDALAARWAAAPMAAPAGR